MKQSKQLIEDMHDKINEIHVSQFNRQKKKKELGNFMIALFLAISVSLIIEGAFQFWSHYIAVAIGIIIFAVTFISYFLTNRDLTLLMKEYKYSTKQKDIHVNALKNIKKISKIKIQATKNFELEEYKITIRPKKISTSFMNVEPSIFKITNKRILILAPNTKFGERMFNIMDSYIKSLRQRNIITKLKPISTSS